MIMTSSPMLHPHPHSIPHTPLSTSPTASPILRPLASSMARSSSGSITPLRLSSPAPATLPRNFGRPPTVRPYQSALCARAGVSGRNVRDVEGDSKEFGDLVFDMIERRGRKTRAGELGAGDEDGRKSKSLGGSLAGSWEKERAELIVDIPVWSPGCFQDLSTLHALRDTTLTHTHSLLAYLLRTHSIPASYRLLARSSTSQSSGWGCIRLAPSAITSPASPKSELRPQVRRSSDVTEKYKKPPIVVPTFSLDEAIADEDESDEDDDDEAEQGKGKVALRPGYNGNNGNNGGSQNEDEVEEETADSQVAKEVERRDAKEGTAFLMTLFGQPALILL